MSPKGSSFAAAIALLLGISLALPATAQRHGGGRAGSGMPGAASRPDGVDEKDTLKDFHDAMAAQATNEQLAQFQNLLKSTEAAQGELKTFLSPADKQIPAPEKLDHSLENIRTLNKAFVDGFSAKQKSLLKDATKRLEKTDASVQEEQRKLDQALEAKATASNQVPALAQGLDKSLTEFSSQQLNLGREMGIPVASGQDLSFSLPSVKSTVHVGEKAIEIAESGELSQTSVEGNQRKFQLTLTTDLSDLQQNISEVLRSQFRNPRECGERLALRQATIAPTVPASVLTLDLHYERWSCIRQAGQSGYSEIAETDGSVEMKLLPVLNSSGTVQLKMDTSRIDATGMMAESIKSGDLGDTLRDQVAQALLPALEGSADFQKLPPVLRQSVKLRNAKFRDSGAAVLSLGLEGDAELSNEQANALASQLNQTLSAQGSTPH